MSTAALALTALASDAILALALAESTQDAKVAALKVQVAVQSEKECSQKQAEETAAAAACKAAEQAAEAAAAAARKAAEQSAEVAALKEEVAAAAALKVAEQEKMAALKAQVAEMQALAAPSAALRRISVEHIVEHTTVHVSYGRALCFFSDSTTPAHLHHLHTICRA